MSTSWLLRLSIPSFSFSTLDSERARETVKRLLDTLRISLPMVLECEDCDSDDSTRGASSAGVCVGYEGPS
ncbi:hypothetical protein BD310DRAFT_923066 [Dichomitus squalens]|uniref:Uncharacterized protein n=1 Tax=Dichomitus squalens TaxID=114155 RepID=A0A4Q9Q106_9APHY|nr:hypothetical protein BD310DRAFT_923066 [Dichomitus squalens]